MKHKEPTVEVKYCILLYTGGRHDKTEVKMQLEIHELLQVWIYRSTVQESQKNSDSQSDKSVYRASMTL